MFGLFKRKHPIVYKQWIVPILGFESDTPKFYAAIEAELVHWEIPELVSERIIFKDGGFLSVQREYFRVRRESLVFDILSAKFGRSWWFSCRSAVLPRSLRWLEIFLFFGVLCNLCAAYWFAFGVYVGNIAMGSSVAMLLVMMIAARSWNGLDDLLLRLPVIGVIYEAIFRAESYYRDDSRRMYVSIVDHLVREQVSKFAKAGGFDEVKFNEITDIQQFSTVMERARAFVGEEVIDGVKEIAKAFIE
jgi:hypothetical protein